MREFKDIIKELRSRSGLSGEELGDRIGVDKSSISKYESGASKPNYDTIFKMAKFFGVSTDYLFGLVSEETGQFGSRSPVNSSGIGRTVKVPILGKIPAGVPVDSTECLIGYKDVPEEQIKNGSYFYLQVKGDSMIGANIPDGCLVLIKKQDEASDGQIVVCRVNESEATLKKFRRHDGQVVLTSANPKYEPIIIQSESARILGVVVKVECEVV